MMRSITLIVSLPRCGTQRLAHVLGKLYGDVAAVRHEPIAHNYAPGLYYRKYDAIHQQLEREPIAGHIRRLTADESDQFYVEVSWQCFAAVPLFIDQFGSRVKLVHLFRHPVNNCFSMMSHRFYYPAWLQSDPSRQLLNPNTVDFIRASETKDWDRISPYEKCLVYWSEMQAYLDELRSLYPETQILSISAESLFDVTSGAHERLTDFIGLPARPLTAESERVIDRYSRRAVLFDDWQAIFRHPEIVRVARGLGYDFENITQHALLKRYGPKRWPHAQLLGYRVLAKHPRLLRVARRLKRSLSPGAKS